ncbi:hypothetical protein C1H46_043086 [Malus baccata]|uniref:Complex 1 LYR protein domain-containing protein n=1 Tax=Malus baccata TaxID=106549 RepID=A0A540KAZ3_MALBA|nr:hypothetical protein C1H46_043086 [Malus baccata]
MSGEALQVAKVYCHLLKAVKKHVAKEENKRHFIKYTTEEFRNNCKLSDPSSIQHKIKLAENYTLLLNSVHHHKDLLFSYNIAVDRTDEMKRVLGKSAASVGLQLPDDLLFSYNIAVDRTYEMKRVLGKSAASVGLQLPDVYQP